MNNTNVTYACRKRRKPVQKTVKPAPSEGAKSNPSKRHRDRLNTELDRLASLLPFPQDVISKLDKLSVLRLSVSYLRAKSFFDVALKSSSSIQSDKNGINDTCRTKRRDSLNLQEGELLLQALNGFVLVVTTDALVFYASSTIQDYLGFQQSDVIHQSVFELIHTEDRPEFQRQLHWALNPVQYADPGQRLPEDSELSQPTTYYNPEQLPPENSSFMERCFICRLRCLLDNSSGFLAMNFQGRLKFLHGQNKKGKDGTAIAPQLALFAVATPLQPPSILEIRTKNFIFRTKHKLDFTPTGCDAKGKIVLGYSEAELCVRGSGYQFVHAADMLYCAENHIRMIKTGESGMTVFRLLTKENRWAWVQANARLVYKNGRPDYIIATQRPLTDEEGMEHLRKRNLKLPFMFATGEAVLYEVTFPFPALMDPLQVRMKGGTAKEPTAKSALDPDSLHPGSVLGAMLRQDESVYLCPPAPSALPLERSFLNAAPDELSRILARDWQDDLLPVGDGNGATREPSKRPPDGQDQEGLFAESKNSDLYDIMENLGIDFEDIKHMQQDEEFFRAEFARGDDLGDIDITDEILTYVQESLNKSSFLYSGFQQPPPGTPNSSCMVQERLQQQQKQTVEQQQQLCQRMKHMQVNGVFPSWCPSGGRPLPFTAQEPQQYAFSDTQGPPQDFPYKSEVSAYACGQEFIPYNQPPPVLPPPANFTPLDFPVGNFEQSSYPGTADLGGYVGCLQVPGGQQCDPNSQPPMATSQPCYAGAVSMFQCQPEPQPATVDQMQYNPMVSAPHALLNKFQNGLSRGILNEAYPAQLNGLSNAQTTSQLQSLHHHHHHAPEPSPFPDLASNGFL
ncbi:aryl hydrocarbon receptor [Ornithorhynchus anatinus]|uniref:Aryl hydrocarbon receptor n=1 Tax=Ornithorhynchus anatinus TaxID=9258 RepID=F6ZVP3_ORNAN|nr:aryl hydrocarbon receptor [Ornithorhynchus anatinus]